MCGAAQEMRCGKLMRIQYLVAIQPKSFVPKATDGRHKLGYIPNILMETAEPPHISQLWVGDIKYIPPWEVSSIAWPLSWIGSQDGTSPGTSTTPHRFEIRQTQSHESPDRRK